MILTLNPEKTEEAFLNKEKIMEKDDYTKPKLKERTTKKISKVLFEKISTQQLKIQKGSGKLAKLNDIISTVTVEKTLIPVFFHYKRGKIDLINTFLDRASLDQPLGQTKY